MKIKTIFTILLEGLAKPVERVSFKAHGAQKAECTTVYMSILSTAQRSRKKYTGLAQAVLPSLLFVLSLPAYADKILVYGDSLSAAYGMPQDQGWAALLDSELQPAHQVLNASISGETTTGGLGRLPATLTELKPDAVFLALGGNDALLGQPIDGIKANLKQMITLIRDSGARPILAGIAVPPSYGPRYIDQFRKMYIDLANELDVPFFDLYMPDIANNPALMQDDGIHPTAAAQPQIKARIQQFLQTQRFADAELQDKQQPTEHNPPAASESYQTGKINTHR